MSDFATIVTGVSEMAFASFDKVFPVQGATTNTSIMFFGPTGSASVIVFIGEILVIFVTLSSKSFAVPKRVSVFETDKEKIGITLYPLSTRF